MMTYIEILQAITIIISPLYIIRFNLPIVATNSFPSNFLELTLLFTIFMTGVSFAKDGFKWKLLKTKIDPLIILFLLIALIETIVSYDRHGGIGILKAYIIEPVLFYYCLIYQSKKRSSQYILYSLFATGLWLSVYAILEYIFPSLSLAPNEIAQQRVTAVYNSANSLALFIGPIILLAISGYLISKKQLLKVILVVLTIIFSLVMFLTKSRGGLIALFITLSIYLYGYLSLKEKFLKTIWFIIPISLISLLAIFFLQIGFTYKNTDNSFSSISGDTLKIRYVLWQGTTNLLKDHPILGAGLNGFKTLYAQNYKEKTAENLQYPHNIILNFWTELGLGGLIVMIFIFIFNIKTILSSLNLNHILQRDYLVGLSYLTMLLYWIIHGMVDVPYFKNDLSLEFWIVLALIQIWYFNLQEKGRVKEKE